MRPGHFYSSKTKISSGNLIMSESNEVIKCGGPTQNWCAWLNTMPPNPDDFHVKGEVQVANPGVDAILRKREPQGVNPAILLLDQHLVQ
ncbi:MAG: hypothetical protein ACI9QL_005220, partial [Candidatus Omnitrophota bacterium]